MSAQYEVIALRYARHISKRSRHFYRYHSYGEADGPQQMDFYFWILRAPGSVVLVDTGFSQSFFAGGQPEQSVEPVAALGLLGIDPADVSLIILTHLHFDHIGNVSAFGNAQFVVQEEEFRFWDGPDATKSPIASMTDARELAYLRNAAAAGRVTRVAGDCQVVPGVEVRLVGGHSPGQQIVLVDGARPVVLASDALHFYEELEREMLFDTFVNLSDMYAGYRLLADLQRQGALIVAGHDPEVMTRFPPLDAARPELAVVIR